MAVINKKAKRRCLKKSPIKFFGKGSFEFIEGRRTNNNVSIPPVVNHEFMESSPIEELKGTLKKAGYSTLQALTTAALVLPGMLSPIVYAADDDEVDFQYSHFQEGSRAIYGLVPDTTDPSGLNSSVSKIKNNFSPIEVDSLRGHSNVSLTDRVKFAFNYTQDTWGGATPIATAPAVFGVEAPLFKSNADGTVSTTVVGATPYLNGQAYQIAVDGQKNPLLSNFNSDVTGFITTKNNQLTHILATASPETRKQGDFKLAYEWDEAALSVGGGISTERDYESRFGNLGGRLDFNQKRTALNLDLSYTNSDTHATLAHDSLPYIDITAYQLNGQLSIDTSKANANILQGNRQDWGTHFGLTQVLNKDALIGADVSYTRSTGYMANPYKAVEILFIDPEQQQFNPPGVLTGELKALLEQRPNERNQLNLGGRYVQYINVFDAALHFDYHFSTDDWGIHSHTFEADWVQPLGNNWTVTPRIRYYSQDAASFYTPWLVSNQAYQSNLIDSVKGQVFTNNTGQQFFEDTTGTKPIPFDSNGNPILDANGAVVVDSKGNVVTDPNIVGNLYPATKSFDRSKLPAYFSSDQRLSGFGTLSGGVTIAKKFAKGISLETGFEYYTHQGGLKIGGGGEGAYANYDYWVANAALKVNFEALSLGGVGSSHDSPEHHSHGVQAPAGVMFSHMLPKAGDFMVGYRYMYGNQSGDTLNGTNPVSDQTLVASGCGGDPCYLKAGSMSMNMHMLDLMYAPTDWLTLMLMPQFVDMTMSMGALNGAPDLNLVDMNLAQHIPHHIQNGHQTGGIGDLGMYAMFKLYDDGIHHVHITPGVSAPTGDVDIQLGRNHTVDGGFIDYGMQLGSGTWDFKPSLTYNGQWDEFSWGAQANGTVRMQNHNKSGYALGDIFQATAWGGYSLTHWLTASVRGVYTTQGGIKGQYNGSANGQFYDSVDPTTGIPTYSSILKFGPMDYPSNYGGRYWDAGFGLSAVVPGGALAGNRVSVEWLQPVFDDPNGYQLKREGALSATWSYHFSGF